MSKKYLKKHRYSKGVQNEIDDLDYLDKLPQKEREWMEQFMYENYGNGSYHIEPDKRILKTEEQLKDARRNNNNTNRDALAYIKKTGMALNADDIMYKLHNEEEHDWQSVYKQFGFNETVFFLCEDAATELGLTANMKMARILCKFYVRMKKLRLMLKKDGELTPKRCEECNISRPKVHFADDLRTTNGKAKVCLVCKGEL